VLNAVLKEYQRQKDQEDKE
jgi:hypothetical protein